MPIELVWSILCRKLIVNQITGAPGLIDVIVAVDINDSLSAAENIGENVHHDIGDVSFVFAFKATESWTGQSSVDFSFRNPDGQSFEDSASLDLEENSDVCFISYNFQNNFYDTPAEAGQYSTDFFVEISIEGKIIDTLTVPIFITLSEDK